MLRFLHYLAENCDCRKILLNFSAFFSARPAANTIYPPIHSGRTFQRPYGIIQAGEAYGPYGPLQTVVKRCRVTNKIEWVVMLYDVVWC